MRSTTARHWKINVLIFITFTLVGGYAMSLMEQGWGVGIKIEDGSNRALNPVIIETLKQLGTLTREDETRLEAYHHPLIVNHRKETVGAIRAKFSLVN